MMANLSAFYTGESVRTGPESSPVRWSGACKRDLGTPAIWGPRPKNASDVRTPLDPISLAVQGSRQRRGDPLMRAGWTMTAIDESGLDNDR